MLIRTITPLLLLFTVLTGCASQPPAPPREFRAAWVASVVNIDWPSKPGLSVEDQTREMTAILERAAELKLNAIILQVRTSCDALYPSELEPWSEYLTGEQGKPPELPYDPLAAWVDEAHERGIELHAWFNPYRARHPNARTPEAPNHVARTKPHIVKQYGGYLWLDPGEQEAEDHTVAVFLDVVRRYDVDGVHIDDYFYPYPDPKAGEFPDDASWQKYQFSGGQLSRPDWRRDNINRTIQRIYREVHAVKPHVKFGISPFGIWKPGYPEGVKGFNQYESLYADAKLWLNEGWCDYFTPQIYWKIEAPEQPYGALLNWWIGENTKGRHLWPGNFTSRIGDSNPQRRFEPEQIIRQIEVTRATTGSKAQGATGNVHFSMKPLVQNRENISTMLREGPYARPALVPASTWIDDVPPKAPTEASAPAFAAGSQITWEPTDGGEPTWLWTVYVRHEKGWRTHVQPVQQRTFTLQDDPELGAPTTAAAVAAVDRNGNESKRTTVKRRKPETIASK
jgi:uncharacterized lipoprotein YddW (UPF0748 family)